MRRVITFARRWGMRRVAACAFCKFVYRVLRFFYRFDPWHASAPYACREYKHRAVALAASIAPRTVVDIGCGLGEVVARIPAVQRYGLDPAAAVIRAARLLFGRRATFGVASVTEAAAIRGAVSEGEIDLLIMLNWPHGMEIGKLAGAVASLDHLIPVRSILIDTVRPGAIPGSHIHGLGDLKCLGEVVRTVDAGDGFRDLHLIRYRG